MILDNLFTLTEGISAQDLAEVLVGRLEARYPHVFQRYNIERIADAVMDRAEFHAGADELGTSDIAIMLREIVKTLERESAHAVDEAVAEAGPFSYGAKRPRKGTVAYNAMMKRQEQERGKQPIEPRDQMVGTAKVTKNVAEGVGKLSIQQLATISDEALDKAYGYGRSSPGNTFGWQANLMSAAYAKKMIDAGITDIEKISDAIHKGWNVTAEKFVNNPDQFDDTEKLRQAGKLDAKLQQRAKLMKINYAQLDNEEQEKDRVVARALLQAIRGEQGVAEGLPGSLSKSDYTSGKTVKHTSSNCTTCHGRKIMYKLDGKLFADNKQGATKIKCPTCKGTGDKQGVAEGKSHISPSGVKTTMDPQDDDYEINYGKNGLVAKFRKDQGVDVKTGSKKVKEAKSRRYLHLQKLLKRSTNPKTIAQIKALLSKEFPQGVAEGNGTYVKHEKPGSWRRGGYERGLWRAQHSGTRETKGFTDRAARDKWIKDQNKPAVAEALLKTSDRPVRYIIKNGKRIGEVGIDTTYDHKVFYGKLYDGNRNTSGHESIKDALSDLLDDSDWDRRRDRPAPHITVMSANTTPGMAEATGDVKFDKMLKGITAKKAVAKQRKADTQQQARDAFGGMFGGGNPADKLGVGNKDVAEGRKGTLNTKTAQQQNTPKTQDPSNKQVDLREVADQIQQAHDRDSDMTSLVMYMRRRWGTEADPAQRLNEAVQLLNEDLRKWFREKWVRFNPQGKIMGACARGSEREGKPKCLPQSKAHALGKRGRASAAARKRREDPNPERRGAAKNVATKNEALVKKPQPYSDPKWIDDLSAEQLAKLKGTAQTKDPNPQTDIKQKVDEKQDACYHKVKSRYKVWPSAYASGALVQCRKKGAANWGKKSR